MYKLEPFFDNEIRQEEIIEEMHKHRDDVINKLRDIVHPFYVEAFAKMLHYCWQEGLSEAEIVAETLDFYQIDFSAFALDKEAFKYLLTKENDYD